MAGRQTARAAGKAPTRRARAVEYSEKDADPVAWNTALELADGDKRRLEVVAPRIVRVVN